MNFDVHIFGDKSRPFPPEMGHSATPCMMGHIPQHLKIPKKLFPEFQYNLKCSCSTPPPENSKSYRLNDDNQCIKAKVNSALLDHFERGN